MKSLLHALRAWWNRPGPAHIPFPLDADEFARLQQPPPPMPDAPAPAAWPAMLPHPLVLLRWLDTLPPGPEARALRWLVLAELDRSAPAPPAPPAPGAHPFPEAPA